MLQALPIDSFMPEIVAALRRGTTLLVSAPPGSGKTTRVPRALFDSGFADSGGILVLEPRRLAARLAASRVAQELRESLGDTVGYSIRFESVGGPRTRIRFLTEGVFSRRIVQDPSLSGISTVILDEFHERHLATDLALGFVRRLQRRRPDLRLVIMSATLETESLAAFLDQPPVISGGQRPFEVTISHDESRNDDRKLEERVAATVTQILRQDTPGDVLVFLPGAAEIRRSMDVLQPIGERAKLLVIPLHGDLPAAEQVRAVQPAETRRIILATNVAETSVTIPGIGVVIDSGLARVASYSPWSGLPRLTLAKISKASAEQRAGRAGRTQAGRVCRLYSRYDFESRPEREQPEVRRADLAETVLTLHGAGVEDVRSFEWLENPPPQALEAAETLLGRLGALDPSGHLTDIGRLMLDFPVHPRLARLILEGERRGVGEDAALLAALLSERDIRLDIRTNIRDDKRRKTVAASGTSDLVEMMDRFREAEVARFDRGRVLSLGLDPGAVDSTERARRKLTGLLGRSARKSRTADDESLRRATLAAFPDRVAKRPATGSDTLVLASGGAARLSKSSVVHSAALMVAVDAEERGGKRGAADTQGVLVRTASAIEAEWLSQLFPEAIAEQSTLNWNESASRVDAVRRVSYLQLVLKEEVRPAPVSEDTSRLLAERALEHNASVFADGEKVPELKERILLASRYFPRMEFPILEDELLRQTVAQLCEGRRSFAELSRLSLPGAILNRLTVRQRELLSHEVPDRIRLQARQVKVHYDPGRSPWIESRLQDFFGMDRCPAICSGKVPLTVHLLAPNGRPVQVTQDLAGFWQRDYPAVKRELKRRYPKHAWP